MDKLVHHLVDLALKEDIRNGDITTQAIYKGNERAKATIWAKESGVIAGLDLAAYIFDKVDPELTLKNYFSDGDKIEKGDIIADVYGPSDSILTGERTVLNFMQRMSGVATKTRLFADSIAHTNTKLLDTRKTMPGHRYLDKWAVRLGGGKNHRYCLDDLYLIKENHIAIAGGISQAINACVNHRLRNRFSWKIEVEVRSIEDLEEVLSNDNVDYVLLDNMSIKQLSTAVKRVDGKIKTEASGNMTLERLPVVAETGVDFISVGAITHSVNALDISLLFD